MRLRIASPFSTPARLGGRRGGGAAQRGLGDRGAGGQESDGGADGEDVACRCGPESSHDALVVRPVLESSLIASVNRGPSTVTRPPWRSAIARTMARPR